MMNPAKLSQVLCIGFLLSLAACGSEDSGSAGDTTSGGGRPGIGDTDGTRPGVDVSVPDEDPDDAGADDTATAPDSSGGRDIGLPPNDVSPPTDTGAADTATPDTVTPPVDGGFGDIREDVRQAIADAVAASAAHTDTFCACYQAGDPYNGSEVACRNELDGISILPLPCDTPIALEFPDDALAFYTCRKGVADRLNTCFQPCTSRQAAILSCVLTAATDAVACGNGRDPAFIAAYEACHP
jgi:hypothetical protein